ncbi:WYL domain-containing protein [uncultured Bacteroides sp.]|uniref:helix-turn-helix transcriptional regulator n=1 Tax=uncultured Bacteroides sp. TaxID=162156 RepID=UPI00260A364E|nr:WYL domain-containing protein [uncultured Bacteroides sp.]
MATNKQAIIRYQVLDRCFRNTVRRYFIEDLKKECDDVLHRLGFTGVEKRQIYNDIKFMESAAGWGISLSKLRVDGYTYYRYKDPDFSINNMPLSEGDIDVLKETILSIKVLKGMPQFEWMEEVITRMEGILYLERGSRSPVVEFEQNPYLKGIEMLSGIFNAIVTHQPLKVTYRSYKSKEFAWVIHPYYLKQYNNRWFLFGLNSDGNIISNLAVDRIASYEIADGIAYISNDSIDFEQYFNDVVGVTVKKDASPQRITLQFDEERWPYVISKPLHRSQRIIDASQRSIEIMVIPNNELLALLLSFGHQVEVLSPADLRAQIHSIFQAGAIKYLECT